jgi:hypothetical protein
MLIFEKGHFRTPTRFAGVFEARGEKLNRFLRTLEPPRHDAWRPERHSENPEEVEKASRIIKKLYAWVNDCVKQMAPIPKSNRVDAAGMGRYLPDEIEDESPLEDSDASGEPLSGEIVEQKRPAMRPESSEQGASDYGPSGAGEGPEIKSPVGSNEGYGGQPATGQGDGGEGRGREGSSPRSGGGPSMRKAPFRLERVRAYCVDGAKGHYKLVLVPKESGKARIKVNLVGEVEVEKAKVAAARDLENGERIPVDGQGRLGPVDLEAGKKYVIEIALAEGLRCALGVDADAD